MAIKVCTLININKNLNIGSILKQIKLKHILNCFIVAVSMNNIIFQVVIICSVLACVKAGLIGAEAPRYSDASAVSHSYIHTSNGPGVQAQAAPVLQAQPAHLNAYQISSPASSPIAMHNPAITQNYYRSNQALAHFTKIVNDGSSSFQGFDSRYTNRHAPVAPAYPASQFAAYSHNAPVSYTNVVEQMPAYAQPQAQTVIPKVYSQQAPIPIQAQPVQVNKGPVPYSLASSVSHTSFNSPIVQYKW